MAPQVEEVTDVVSNKAVDAQNNPVEVQKKEAELDSKNEAVAKSAEVTESAESKDVEKKTESSDEVKDDSEDKVDSQKVEEEKKPVEPVAVEPVVAEATNGQVQSSEADEAVEKPKVVDADEKPAEVQSSNGDQKVDEQSREADQKEPVAEETNGVCKRKVENGAEVVDDEKSPKKAKVVDEGDQAQVEETAA